MSRGQKHLRIKNTSLELTQKNINLLLLQIHRGNANFIMRVDIAVESF